MNTLVFTSRTLDELDYVAALKDTGGKLFAIVDEEKFSPGDRERFPGFSEIIPVANFGNGGIAEKEALALHRREGFGRIVAIAEYDMLRAAKLREHLGLAGQGYESTLAFRDKVKMKERLAAAGIPVPRFRRVDTPLDVLAVVEQCGLPVVVKPFRGAGASETRVVRTQEDLDEVLSTGLTFAPFIPSYFEVEEFIEGVMYHVNGVWQRDRSVFIWPSKYLRLPSIIDELGVIDGQQLAYQVTPDDPLNRRLCELTDRVMAALPDPGNAVFHAEIFHTPDDRLVVCEIASRPGGGRIAPLYRQAFGLELYACAARAQAGLEPIDPRLTVHQGVREHVGGLELLTQNGVLESAPRECTLPGVVAFSCEGVPGRSYMRDSTQDLMGHAVAVAESEAQLAERLAAIESWFRRETKWR